jgi:predicted nucleotidyltransferase
LAANERKSMIYIYSPKMQQQLQDSIELLKAILGTDLLGVYLYGSSLVGGLQKYSDIDLFVVTNRRTSSEEKIRLITNLLQISGIYMKSSKLPIEMTLVEKSLINPWQYPPHFDFLYGDWLRESFENGGIEPWLTYEMPDLALIVTQILLKSHTLWGLEPEQLLAHVPYHDFMKAMLHDLNRLATDLAQDTRNVFLTYARIWSTLETNSIRSKPAAADWVMNLLPKIYQPVMKRAKLISMGVENEHWDDMEGLVKSCADFMKDKINEQTSLINFDDPNMAIKLTEEPFSGDLSLQSE